MAGSIVDPHFHFWVSGVLDQLVNFKSSTHPMSLLRQSEAELFNDNIKGIYETIPTYLASEYAGDATSRGRGLVGAVHVEAVVGQKDGGVVVDPVAETRVVAREAANLPFPVRAVVYVNLTRPNVAEVIAEHRLAAPGERGKRARRGPRVCTRIPCRRACGGHPHDSELPQ